MFHENLWLLHLFGFSDVVHYADIISQNIRDATSMLRNIGHKNDTSMKFLEII